MYTPAGTPVASVTPISGTPFISPMPSGYGFHPIITPQQGHMRLLGPNTSHSSHEGYVAGNPFQSSIHRVTVDVLPTTTQPVSPAKLSSRFSLRIRRIYLFFSRRTSKNNFLMKLDNCIRHTYHIIFLRLPMFYFTRVIRIFKEVRLSADDLMKTIIRELVQQQAPGQALGTTAYFIDPNIPEVSSLRILWEGFIDSLMREWKTINIVAILLLT